jgi:glycosyltransferase involved in cell wall biosynthesis
LCSVPRRAIRPRRWPLFPYAALFRSRLGFLGRLVPERGALALGAAVAELAARGIAVELTIGGDGPERAAIARAAAGAPVTLLGTVDRDRLLAEVDVLAIPSRWHEPFGLVAAEAAARGVPVVASRRGGLPEIVDDGVTGWLYDPDRPGALRHALAAAIGDRGRLAAIGAAARARSTRFHPDRQLDAYVAVYDRALTASQTAARSPAVAATSRAAVENRRR